MIPLSSNLDRKTVFQKNKFLYFFSVVAKWLVLCWDIFGVAHTSITGHTKLSKHLFSIKHNKICIFSNNNKKNVKNENTSYQLLLSHTFVSYCVCSRVRELLFYRMSNLFYNLPNCLLNCWIKIDGYMLHGTRKKNERKR